MSDLGSPKAFLTCGTFDSNLTQNLLNLVVQISLHFEPKVTEPQLVSQWECSRGRISMFLTLSGPWRDSEARMTKFTAVLQKPLNLQCPTFVTFSFYLYDILWPNSTEIGQSEGCCYSSLIETSEKCWKWKNFPLLENCWNWHWRSILG